MFMHQGPGFSAQCRMDTELGHSEVGNQRRPSAGLQATIILDVCDVVNTALLIHVYHASWDAAVLTSRLAYVLVSALYRV